MKLYIKNMLSIRCIMVVKYELEKLDIAYHDVKIGYIDLKTKLSDEQFKKLEERLIACDLEIVEKVRNVADIRRRARKCINPYSAFLYKPVGFHDGPSIHVF